MESSERRVPGKRSITRIGLPGSKIKRSFHSEAPVYILESGGGRASKFRISLLVFYEGGEGDLGL
jgi:hypothetical protein